MREISRQLTPALLLRFLPRFVGFITFFSLGCHELLPTSGAGVRLKKIGCRRWIGFLFVYAAITVLQKYHWRFDSSNLKISYLYSNILPTEETRFHNFISVLGASGY